MSARNAALLVLAMIVVIITITVLLVADALDQECHFSGSSSRTVIEGVEQISFTEERTCR